MVKSKRSGGPQTTEGKLAISRNALKTGAYTSIIVLPGESEADFQELLGQFLSDFSPRDIAERAMTRELAVLTWKKLRLERMEHAALIRGLNAPIERYELSRHGVRVEESCERLLSQPDELTKERGDDRRKALRHARHFKAKPMTDEEFSALAQECPTLYVEIIAYASMTYDFGKSEPSPGEVLSLRVKAESGREERFLDHAIRKVISVLEPIIRFYDNLDAIKAAIADIKGQRLLNLLEMKGPTRVHDDLSRAFFRALAELRRHQQWRRQIDTVDVTPELEATPEK